MAAFCTKGGILQQNRRRPFHLSRKIRSENLLAREPSLTGTLLAYGARDVSTLEAGTANDVYGRDAHMSKYDNLPTDLEGFDSLAELALDMRWSWNHATDDVWRTLDAALWESTQNPWVVLQTVSRDQIQRAWADPVFRKSVDGMIQRRRREDEAPAWFQKTHPQSPLTCAAYFSMEFMLSEALPIYSGGLGNVAGDQLKATSDLGVPVVGVGLLWQQGYFRQVIAQDGSQQALFPYNAPGQLPITPLRQANGQWLRFQIALPGYAVWLRAWQVQVGRVKLYLLDSNDGANLPAHRAITSELYGGGPELRLQQEIVLGIGGWRLLVALGLKPEVCHLNEGHAAFAVLERARTFMQEAAQPFEVALAVTRAGNLFTTHTAVAAGFDRFAPDLVQRYLGGYAESLGITAADLLALGRQDRNDASEAFNMAYLALRGSGSVNGVSRLHGQVSRHIFRPLFPRWPEEEVPIGHVTNGVHMPTWDSAPADDLWTEACGKDRWLGTAQTVAQGIRGVTDARLWQLRAAARESLVHYARDRLSQQLSASGALPEAVDAAKRLFDPNALTLGFARRFATYKRPNLLLHDPARLLRLLGDRERPVQLIIAGKAHPQDGAGQALIRQWITFLRRPEARPHVIFLADYDMLLTEHLVQGVDVWINTPRRPWEASGTSGMKVLVNGGINLSELDGWWAEAYTPEVGWALGDGQEHGDDPAWDAVEANALYALLERQVVPEFYDRGDGGVPTAWVKRMRESMARLTPQFSTCRTVREYTEGHYLPAALAYRARSARGGAVGKRIALWQQRLEHEWGKIALGAVSVVTRDGQHGFEVAVRFDDLDPDAVLVQLYAVGVASGAPERHEMKRVRRETPPSGGYVYGANVPATRPAADYTARVLPHFEGVAIPLEDSRILWQR
jgi:starch phosphorylase